MESYLTIFINDEPFNCESSMSLKNILLYLNFDINFILVEYNKEILNKFELEYTFLKNNDCLEVITIVGGG
uniref:Thiamin biosynthesis protein S n=1 Tax=Bostrychia simpliciuscula TaxID=324754 RepID=A0A1Z1M8D1_9FLOR|nr:thiamin biosynthesis protein S [Bostrychia simpliciuscula]ARW62172.1 thiamin biosynthesis protein S [Bostrychia simpliciuscula]